MHAVAFRCLLWASMLGASGVVTVFAGYWCLRIIQEVPTAQLLALAACIVALAAVSATGNCC